MKIFIDTNILFSSFISPAGTAAKAFMKAVSGDNEVIITKQNVLELRETIERKYPAKMIMLEKYLTYLFCVVEVVENPCLIMDLEKKIRDIKDRPLLRAALLANVDIIVTGDKDFLESGIAWPMIMSPAEFLQYDLTPTDEPPRVAEP